MSLSIQECISKIKQEYPDFYPVFYVKFKDAYLFNILPRGVNKSEAIMDFHFVDPESGEVSGSIPVMKVYGNAELAKLLEKPFMISSEDQQIEHSFLKNSYYSVRRRSETYDYDSDFLMHYGIPGQKWGVKNGPPYPLDNKVSKKIQNGNNPGSKQLPKKEQVSKGFGTELAFHLAIPVAFAAIGMVATAVADKRAFKGKSREDATKELSKEVLKDIATTREFSDSAPPKKIEGSHSIEEDMAAVNPTFNQTISGTSNNCVLATLAYDMRRRGYDVTANLAKRGMYPLKTIGDMYEGAAVRYVGTEGTKVFETKSSGWDRVTNNILKAYPEGSRGYIGVGSSKGGGHAMAFEIQNGKVMVIDAQSNVKRDLRTDKQLSWCEPSSTSVCRLDNLKVKMSGASVACSELKSDWKQNVNRARIDSGAHITMAQKKQIREYKREHPDSGLSDKEILKNLV